MVPATVNRIFCHVAQSVVHPPHVPLQAIAEAPARSWRRNTGPGSRFFGNHDDTRVAAVDSGVGFLDELDGLKIFSPTELVGAPLTLFTRVVQVEHRCDGIHTQTINMELFKPVVRVCN